jgi:hypothetical protein
MRLPLAFAALAAAVLPVTVGRAQTLLPLECDDGASVAFTYIDSDFENEAQNDDDECNAAPIGDWNRSGFADETGAADVSLVGAVSSEDGLELELENSISLAIEDGEFAAATLLVAADVRFTAPESAEDEIPAEVVVTLERTGEFGSSNLALAVVGPGVSLTEDLDDALDGEARFPVDLEPDEDYTAVLTSTSELDDSEDASQILRFRVEVEAVPEPAGALLLLVGAAVVRASAGSRRRRSSRAR